MASQILLSVHLIFVSFQHFASGIGKGAIVPYDIAIRKINSIFDDEVPDVAGDCLDETKGREEENRERDQGRFSLFSI